MKKTWKKGMTVVTASIMLMASAATSHAQWTQSGANWYYVQSNGSYATGWNKVNNNWYYFNQNGQMLTGWQNLNATWYYFVPNGEMVTGWRVIDGKWYYFRGDGSMTMNQWVGNYYLGASGAMMTNSWVGPYYVGADGMWIQNYGQDTQPAKDTSKTKEEYTWVKDMTPADGNATLAERQIDTLLNEYSNAQKITRYYSPTYYTNEQYRYLTGTIAAYKDFKSGGETTFIIEGSDGEELYSKTINRLTEPITIKVDISGQKFITIKGTEGYNGPGEGDNKIYAVILSDAKFVK